MGKRVAVIGAGVSGLTSIKCCLDEDLEPTCFEQSSDIGGLWRFTEKIEERRASIYNSVITNTCKEMMCFSDFPMPENFPVFLHNSKFLEYLRLYADRFNLLKYIKFNTAIVRIEKTQDYPTTGQWTVVTEKDGKQERFTFDAVMICSGHQIEAFTPLESFPGIEKFKGKFFHSRDYKGLEGLDGKTVLIIGMGNSAADIAVETCRKTKKVFISTRGGTWVISRVDDHGYPWDTVFHTRFNNMLRNSLPWFLLRWMTEKKMNRWFDHENYGLVPQNRSLMKEPVFNDDLPSRILYGAVTVKPLVKKLTESSAIFEDGTIENVDVIIFATGYTVAFPFLDKSVIEVKDNRVPLYKHVFVPHLEKPTLAFIGLIQPLGPIMPTSELQARWATRVFKGLSSLPSESTMVADTTRRNEKRIKWFGTSRSQSIQTDFIPYLDELAAESGANLNRFLLLLKDPRLALSIFFGPCTPFQFRLAGTGKWPGARKAILTQRERIVKATKKRVVTTASSNHNLFSIFKILSFLVLLAAVFLAFGQPSSLPSGGTKTA